MIIEQDTFIGGLDLINPDTQVEQDKYVWLVNGRTRYGYVQPTTLPVEDTNAPTGLKQGLITVGNNVVMFVAGKAWYKLYTSTTWIKIADFSLDASVTNIYSALVPASSRDYLRKQNASGNANDPISITTYSRNSGMPTGIVCQDGINQPQFISFDEVANTFRSRACGTFTSWTQSNPEYVPIGKQMMFLNQKLFIVAPDGLSVYHSVSGQPLNFMVNIDHLGNKTGTETSGGAPSTSFAFDYDPITCLQPVNAQDAFLYATKHTTRIIQLNYNLLIFGEPLYSQVAQLDTGITNQYALVDINGDYAFTNAEGLRNFNAVQQLRFEGRNSVFSKQVSKLFTNLRQTYCVGFSFDNYCIFNVNTTCGYVNVVYDSIAGVWSAIDMFNIGQLMQVDTINLPSEVVVYAITASNKIYRLYNVTAPTAQPFLFTKAFSSRGANQYYGGMASYANSNPPITDLKSQRVDLTFRDGTTAGLVNCSEFVDGVEKETISKPIAIAQTVTPYELLPAIQPLIEPSGERVTFNFNSTPRGFKIGYAITWNTDASLMKIRITTTDISKQTASTQHNATLAQ